MFAPSRPASPADENFAIVLAAGESRRMGHPKALLPWLDGKPLVLWLTDVLADAGWQPVAVCGPGVFSEAAALLPAGRAVLHPHPELGKTTSLLAGLAALPAIGGHLLITAVDQPRPPALYQRLAQAALVQPKSILVPDHQGSRGHPVVIRGSLAPRLLNLGESTLGLRGFLDEHRSDTCRLTGLDASWLQWDFNTPAVYEQALTFFRELPAEAKLKTLP